MNSPGIDTQSLESLVVFRDSWRFAVQTDIRQAEQNHTEYMIKEKSYPQIQFHGVDDNNTHMYSLQQRLSLLYGSLQSYEEIQQSIMSLPGEVILSQDGRRLTTVNLLYSVVYL